MSLDINVTYTDMVEHHPTLQLLTFLGGGDVLELGVRAGDSTLRLLEAARIAGVSVTGVDVDPCIDAMHRVCAAGYGDLWTFVQSDSLTADIPTSGWGLVFIDTLHTYEQTVGELERFQARYVALHDSEDDDVRRAIDEHVARTGLRELRWTNSYGLSVLM